MSTPRYQTVSIACPSCQNPFVTPILTIVDAGKSPEAKALFLSGRLNVAVCPQCGHAGMLTTPLVYHDPEKELLFALVPSELNLPETERQQVIGDLTNQVMFALPAEERKGYLLRPRTFLRLEGMVEAILEADGITPEMLEARRAKASLLDRLIRATSEDARRTIAEENDAQIDYEFFQLLTLNLELAAADGQEQVVQDLQALREQLLNWTTVGQEAASREDAIRSLGTEITREDLLAKLVEAALAGEGVKVETMVAYARPAIDYVFYQKLSERIEAAEKDSDAEQAETLKELRKTILDLTEQIDAEVKQATDEANQFLQEILESDDPQKTIRANPQRVDDLFLGVLAANIEMAERAGRPEDAQKLEEINNLIFELIQENQPPELRFISQLLATEVPEGTQALLEENRPQVNATLLELMDLIVQDLTTRGRGETAQRLGQIRELAEAMVE